MITPAIMRTWIVFAATIMLAACNKGDQAQDAAPEAAASAAPASFTPLPAAPPAAPSMIAPVDATPRAAAKVAGLPEDVLRLSERIAQCEHFAGEEAYDAERGAFLRQQVAATCPGNTAELQRLRQKYAANPAAARHLSALEAIEM